MRFPAKQSVDANRARRCLAFTLLETLVTIALIGLLIAVLIPTVASARESARKAVCTSNLREVHSAVLQYALENRQRVPLGHRGGRRQWNTMVFSGTSNVYVLFGRLYVGDYLHEGEVFYCPSERAEDQAFDTQINPWPPGVPGVNVQGGYASNPLGDRYDWGFGEFPPNGMVRLDKLGTAALLADGTGLPDRVDSRHKTGVNVLSTDGAVHWIERAAFDEPLSECSGISPMNNDAQDRVWAALTSQFAGRVEPIE